MYFAPESYQLSVKKRSPIFESKKAYDAFFFKPVFEKIKYFPFSRLKNDFYGM